MNKKEKQKNELERDYLLDFLMKSNSLKDLLEILSNICKNLDLSYLNPKLKHFRYFQFTFFGLMVKAKSLIELMIYRADFLKNKIDVFKEIHFELAKIKDEINYAFEVIKKNKMIEGKNRIIEINKKYAILFENMTNEIKI